VVLTALVAGRGAVGVDVLHGLREEAAEASRCEAVSVASISSSISPRARSSFASTCSPFVESSMIARRRSARSRRTPDQTGVLETVRTPTRFVASMPSDSTSIC